MTKPAMRPHRRHGATNPGAALIRRRVTQETIDEMAELRRQGLTFQETGQRVGCSERTARRYVGRVQPQLHLPSANPEPEVEDHQMRERLARWFSDLLYKLNEDPRPRESVTFLMEATRMLRERLDATDPLTLELMIKDVELRKRFVVEVVGRLYSDYKIIVHMDVEFGQMSPSQAAAGWRPPRERPVIEPEDDDCFPEDEV
jgi:DNA-binding CsgD family transcriptional regulator